MNKALLAGAAATLVGALALWYFLESGSGSGPDAPQPADVSVPKAPAAASAAIAHPLPAAASAASGAAEPELPSLDASDAPLLAALSEAIGEGAVRDDLEGSQLIRRLVVTVDNIPRQKIPVDRRPVKRVGASFHAEGDELHATLDPRNYTRYAPYVAVVRNLDVAALVRIYLHFYPLLQRAYQDLGYPTGYFNDRLIEAIDTLLAAPQPTGPIELVRPNVMYEFADPKLEALSAGEKLMIRLGPDNAAQVKAKLGELRAALTAAPAH